MSTNNSSQTLRLLSVTVQYNRIPNAPVPIWPDEDVWLNDNLPVFNWTYNDPDSDEQYGLHWQADNMSNFSSIDFDSNIYQKMKDMIEGLTHYDKEIWDKLQVRL